MGDGDRDEDDASLGATSAGPGLWRVQAKHGGAFFFFFIFFFSHLSYL